MYLFNLKKKNLQLTEEHLYLSCTFKELCWILPAEKWPGPDLMGTYFCKERKRRKDVKNKQTKKPNHKATWFFL